MASTSAVEREPNFADRSSESLKERLLRKKADLSDNARMFQCARDIDALDNGVRDMAA